MPNSCSLSLRQPEKKLCQQLRKSRQSLEEDFLEIIGAITIYALDLKKNKNPLSFISATQSPPNGVIMTASALLVLIRQITNEQSNEVQRQM